MKVLEDLVPSHLSDEIETLLNSERFTWNCQPHITYDSGMEYKNPKITNPVGLTHTLYFDGQITSDWFNDFEPILTYLEARENITISEILRIRIRRTLQTVGHDLTCYNSPHVDLAHKDAYKTLVYYADDSDGDTVLFEEIYKSEDGTNTVRDDVTEWKRSTPKKGSGLFFEGHRFHAGNCPVNSRIRTIINFDFYIKEQNEYTF
jgi:hypothetical protein